MENDRYLVSKIMVLPLFSNKFNDFMTKYGWSLRAEQEIVCLMAGGNEQILKLINEPDERTRCYFTKIFRHRLNRKNKFACIIIIA